MYDPPVEVVPLVVDPDDPTSPGSVPTGMDESLDDRPGLTRDLRRLRQQLCLQAVVADGRDLRSNRPRRIPDWIRKGPFGWK